MSVVLGVIETVVVPVILVTLVVFAFLVPGRLRTEVRSAAYAGSCAGLVLCALYVVAVAPAQTSLEPFVADSRAGVLGVVRGIGLEKLGLVPGSFLGGALGLVCGIVSAWIYRRVRRTRNVGYACLFLATSASVSLVNLFFVPTLHSFTLTFTLCAVLVYMIYLMWPPPTAEESPQGDTAVP